MRGRCIRVVIGLASVLVSVLAAGACAPTSTPFTAPPPPLVVAPWPDLAWTTGELPAVPGRAIDEHIAAVTAGAEGLVAVGWHEAGPQRDGVIWWSDDGIAWDRVGLPDALEGVDLVDVAVGVDGFVAIGGTSGDPFVGVRSQVVILHSVDGRRWARPLVPGALDAFAGAVAGGPNGYVAVGFGEAGEAIGWTSPDGMTWARTPGEDLRDGVAGIGDPQADGDGWRAVGTSSSGPVSLRSSDGIGWTATPIESSSNSFANLLVVGRWGYLVQGGQGSCGPFASCPADTVTWWSGDGETWGRTDDGEPLGSGVTVLAPAGDHGVVAVDFGERMVKRGWLVVDPAA